MKTAIKPLLTAALGRRAREAMFEALIADCKFTYRYQRIRALEHHPKRRVRPKHPS